MSESKALVRGTFLLTASILITKILGILYLIPFYAIIGDEKNLAPFTYAYQPYTIMITIATAGVPLAAAKYVSKYNALGAYKVSQKLYRSSFIVMSITGLIGFLLLFFLSPTIAQLTLANKGGIEGGWKVEDITNVIRTISFVVLFIPLLATWRGIFQGFNSMGPTAVSEVTEQIARIAFILGGSYIVLYVMDGSVLVANQVATFAAGIGAIVALLTLLYYWIKRRHLIKAEVAQDTSDIDVSYVKIYKEIIKYSIPFVIVSLCFPIINLIDQFTHNTGLAIGGVNSSLHDVYFTMLSMTTNKIVMIPTSLAAGFAVSLVPFITNTYNSGRIDEMHIQIRKSLGVLLYLTVPASLGIMVLAQPLYNVFYSYSPMGTEILFWYAPVSILIALLSVTASMLQGIDKQALTVWIVIGALGVKAIINLPLIIAFNTLGAVLGTAIALLIAVALNCYVLWKHANYKFNVTIQHTLRILFYTIIMMLFVELSYFIISLIIDPTSKLGALIVLIVGALVGMIVYGYLTMRSRLADEFFGDLTAKIRRKIKWV
ncbi:polysaccharide biosynthesis protein [Mammaliicoccus lentus]|jgi:O-antigen/teichoic acid export membrane protein|uniref:putative polysaccharide biosynthesis protein n=1 Tax=Mammaliicoccus TaxID=2803850 RepID=UPI0007D8D66D|nr:MULTISPECIES: polysaccharide biosynthesis protein [Mammaliicoccus]HBV02716.1 polysaccharide biosynthesis protein [Staphylococcus sp.]MBF0750078.1 polysaccharide biosynthesis protein [Mammaliicoccus lentus]MBF0793639.1 polysaccharide biosynthesis protein [Mammaliicoccus lentus]MBW0761986.1 polysaccharide biosynthesis protein [Mammaliicoccus lentus]MBW0770299.1 polysaccharide biosynthesis protein [Mammaliicoccus lentus]